MMADRATTSSERLRLGDAEYLWRAGHLHDNRGRDVQLRAKSLKLFAALLAERGTVLSKDRLSDLVWPNTTATDESIARCISDIRKALRDKGHDIVETFPKQGYRLNVLAEPGVEPRAGTLKWGVGLAFVAGIFLALAAWLYVSPSVIPQNSTAIIERASTIRNTVAIIPFVTDAEEDRFLADGLAEDLEVHLAEVSGVRILSQAQTSVAEAESMPAADLARTLDTKYLIEGRVRQNGPQIAVSLRLIDGADGATLWANRYEGAREGILEFRDSVPAALVAAMSVDLSRKDRQRLARRDTEYPEAFEDVMRARQALSLFTYEGNLAAEKHLRRAIERDPNYARAYAELASAFVIRLENDWIVLSGADTAKAFYFAEKALELDPDLWFGHYAPGRLHSVAETGDIDAARAHLRTAMELQPANDDARIYYAIVMMMSGELDEATRILESVLATHPQPPFWYHLGMANALFHQERYDDALQAVSHCVAQMPNSPYCLRTQIAVLARMDRISDAQWAIEEYAILGHEASIDGVMRAAIERDSSMRAHLRESYELAGLE